MHSIHVKWAQTLTQDIKRAKTSISITALSMHITKGSATGVYAALFYELETAIKRGIAVSIYLPAASKIHPAASQNFTTLEHLRKLGALTHQVGLPSLLHAKTCVIDNRIVFIGSGNWTAAAAGLNREIYARIIDEKIALELLSHHSNLLQPQEIGSISKW